MQNWLLRPGSVFLAAMLAGALFLAPTARAHEGHDEAPDVAARTAVAIAPGGPRFVAASADFELVGLLAGQTLTLYLDRFADNAPVVDARLELDLDGTKVVARPLADRYVADLPSALRTGSTPIVATVIAGDASDLLAGEINVPAPPAPSPATADRPTARWLTVAGSLLALAAAVIVGLRRRRARR